MSRRDWRSRSRRELTRTTRAKTMKCFELYREGFGHHAIAAKLGISLEQVDELFSVVEEPGLEGEEAIATQGVGGGQG